MMRKYLALTFAFILAGVSIAGATDDPHGTTNSITCEQCHISHGTLGDLLVNATDSLVSTLCLSCHTPGGWVSMNKELSSSQKASPGVSGSSHSWDVDAINSTYGATLPQQAALFDHLTADSSITCATCHDPHSNTNSPFLRLDNSADALCLDCHRDRDMSSVKTYSGNDLSHPVGIALPATATFHNPPLDVDGSPQPSDGNTTNDYQLGAGDIIQCTTCHGVHYTDSNSGSVDGP
jgi:predicted CXXCH cytochrome family protein